MDSLAHYRVFSFGGGRQSMAVLVAQSLGLLPYTFDYFVFANVGAKAEKPATLRYLNEVAKPYAERHGIKLIETERINRQGKPVDLYEYTMAADKSVPIPVYMAGGAPGNRTCTTDWKIKVIDRWVKGMASGLRVEIGLGISLDEVERMKVSQWSDRQAGKEGRPLGYWKRPVYPLIDLRWFVNDCVNLIESAGLPLPVKSSCWFCPFQSRSQWVDMRRSDPDLFDRALGLEARINQTREHLGRDSVYLHRALQPLDQAVSSQMSLFPDDDCTGYCHT